MTSNQFQTKRIAVGVAVALSLWATNSVASYGTSNIKVDGVTFTPTTVNGTTVIGSSDSQNVTFNGGNYAIVSGLNSNTSGINEHVVIHGKNIEFYGYNANQGIVWARGDRVNAKMTIGDTKTEKSYIKSTGAKGIALWASGKNGNGSSQIDIEGKLFQVESAFGGICVQNNGESNPPPSSRSIININSDQTIINAKEMEISVWSNGLVNVNSNIEVTAKNVIDARGNSNLNLNLDGQHTTVLNGDIVFETPNSPDNAQNSGKIINANVNVNLTGNSSYWKGSAYQYYKVNGEYQKSVELEAEPYHGNVTGFKMSIGSGAKWDMTDNSFINNLALNEGGTVNIENSVTTVNATEIDMSGGAFNVQGNASIKTNKLTGTGGAISLAATLNDDQTIQSGTLTVKDPVNTDMNLKVAVTGLTADDITDKKAAMESLNSKVTTTGDSKLSKVNTISEGDVKGALSQFVDAAGNAGAVKEAVNQKLDGYSSIAALSAVQWRHENDTLLKRMGELRDLEGTVGAWARLYGSEQEYGAQSVTTQNTTIQVGADYDVGQGWKVGGAFSYTDGSSTFDNGNSNNDMYGLAVYGTWLAENGQFVDLIGKYSRLSNEFTSGTMKGDFDNNAFSLAAEAGWHFKLNNLGYVEPSAGLTYGRIMGDTFTAQNGVLVEQEDYDSLIARIGVRSGFYFPNQKGNIYTRVAVLHDFMGDMESTASKANAQGKVQTSHLKDELGDTWVEYGLGANFKLSKTAYTFVDLEKTTGGDVKEAWKWTLGARLAF